MHTNNMFERIHKRARSMAQGMVYKKAEREAQGVAERIVHTVERRRKNPLKGEELLKAHLRRFIESWIEADYQLEQWALREDFGRLMQNVVPYWGQPENGPVV